MQRCAYTVGVRVRCNAVLALSVSECDATLCLHCRCPSAMQRCAYIVGVRVRCNDSVYFPVENGRGMELTRQPLYVKRNI
jgi:hypothetical protein